MSDDPDATKYERAIEKKDPRYQAELLDEIEIHLRYGIPSIKFIGWVIVVLLVLILYKVW
jgi:hypothetical protein